MFGSRRKASGVHPRALARIVAGGLMVGGSAALGIGVMSMHAAQAAEPTTSSASAAAGATTSSDTKSAPSTAVHAVKHHPRATTTATPVNGASAQHANTTTVASKTPAASTAAAKSAGATAPNSATAAKTVSGPPAPATASVPSSGPASVRPGSRGAINRFASTSPSVTPVPSARASRIGANPAQSGVPDLTPQSDRTVYHYDALGRRDPFQALVGGGFVGKDVGGNAPPDVGAIKVVGIVWGTEDKFALVEDAAGNSLVLRKGDKVMNGFVEDLKRDALVIKISADGVEQSVTIPLTQKGDNSNDKH